MALVDLDAAGAERNAAAVRELGGEAARFGVNVADGSVRATVERAEAALGPIDVLVNGAGITRAAPLWETTLEEFDQVMERERAGRLRVSAGGDARHDGAAPWARDLAKQHHRQAGRRRVRLSPLRGSKAAVIGLCHGAARQLGPYGITSNAIAPGPVTRI